MPNDLHIPRFSDAEYQRRYKLTQDWMVGDGLDVLVIYGNSHRPDNIRWLAAFAPRSDTYLIFPQVGVPTLFTQLFNHVPNAQRVSVIADTRWGGIESIDTVGNELSARGITKGKIGLVGPVPYKDYLALAARFTRIEFGDAARDFQSLRLVKSQEELDWLRQGAAFSDAAVAAMMDATVPGVSEHELAAVIESAYTAAGGEHGIHFLSSTPMNAPQSYVPAQKQTARRLQIGDVVINEISAGIGGYFGQIHRPFTVGCEATPLYRRIYDVTFETYERIMAALRPGATVGQVLDAADYVQAQGLTVCDDLLHGYGMGYLPPVLRTRATAHKQPPDSWTFKENMAVVVQPNVYDPDSGAGLQVGNLVYITATGANSLQKYPMSFHVIGKKR